MNGELALPRPTAEARPAKADPVVKQPSKHSQLFAQVKRALSTANPTAKRLVTQSESEEDEGTSETSSEEEGVDDEAQQRQPKPKAISAQVRAKVAQAATANAVVTAAAENAAEKIVMTEQERILNEDPCAVLMCGDVTLEVLGWHFKAEQLEELRPTEVAQDMGSSAQQSATSRMNSRQQQASGTLLSAVLNWKSGGAAVASSPSSFDEVTERIYNQSIEPRFRNSEFLQESLLQPQASYHQNHHGTLRTKQTESDLWRLMVDSTAPSGLWYLNEAWFKWRAVTGPQAIPGRFNQLSVFRMQMPPPTKPKFANTNQPLKVRRQSLREETLAKVRQCATRNFPALVGGSWYWWPSLDQFTLEQLIKSKTELKQLFVEVPSNSVAITDFIVLFNLGPLPLVQQASSSEVVYSEKDARRWLKKLRYNPSIHFIVGTERFPVAVLTQPPYNIKWEDLYKYHFRYTDIYGWRGFFSPRELMQLGFSFEQALSEGDDSTRKDSSSNSNKNRQVLTADYFRIMVEKGKWTYHTLCECLDFTVEVIQRLGLTQVDLRDKLKWKPLVETTTTLDATTTTITAASLLLQQKLPTEWLSQASFSDLLSGEQRRKGKRHKRKSEDSEDENDDDEGDDTDKKRSKHKSKIKHKRKPKSRKRREKEEEIVSDNSEG